MSMECDCTESTIQVSSESLEAALHYCEELRQASDESHDLLYRKITDCPAADLRAYRAEAQRDKALADAAARVLDILLGISTP